MDEDSRQEASRTLPPPPKRMRCDGSEETSEENNRHRVVLFTLIDVNRRSSSEGLTSSAIVSNTTSVQEFEVILLKAYPYLFHDVEVYRCRAEAEKQERALTSRDLLTDAYNGVEPLACVYYDDNYRHKWSVASIPEDAKVLVHVQVKKAEAISRLRACALEMSPDASVGQLKLALASRYSSWLGRVDPDTLCMYASAEELEGDRQQVRSSASVTSWGHDKDHPYVALVPPVVDSSLKWTQDTQLYPMVPIGSLNGWMTIPNRYLEGSGIQATGDLILYRSTELNFVWGEIQRVVLDHDAMLSLAGPRGSGKSWAAYACVCGYVDRSEWDVLWLHFHEDGGELFCVKFSGQIKARCVIANSCDREQRVQEILGSLNQRKTIVFLDGLREHDQLARDIFHKCAGWKSRQSDLARRFVCLAYSISLKGVFPSSKSEVVGRADPTLQVDPSAGEMSPRMALQTRGSRTPSIHYHELGRQHSWRLTDYLATVGDDGFFLSVEANLVPRIKDRKGIATPLSRRKALVRDKFYVAGGNARFMFAQTVDEVVSTLQHASGRFHALRIEDTSGYKSSAFSTLFTHYYTGSFGSTYIVSHLAAKMVASRVQLPTSYIRLDMFGKFDFEAKFLSLLASQGVDRWPIDDPGTRETAGPLSPSFFDPEATPLELSCGWNLPTRSTQDTYDAVVVTVRDDKLVIAFVHFMRERDATPPFVCEPYFQLLRRLALTLEFSKMGVVLEYVGSEAWMSGFKVPQTRTEFEEQILEPVFGGLGGEVTCETSVFATEIR